MFKRVITDIGGNTKSATVAATYNTEREAYEAAKEEAGHYADAGFTVWDSAVNGKPHRKLHPDGSITMEPDLSGFLLQLNQHECLHLAVYAYYEMTEQEAEQLADIYFKDHHKNGNPK